MAKTKKEKEFDGILLEAIDEALLSLGQNVQMSIYFHLETKFGLPKQFIPDRVSDFSNAIEKIFGPASKKIEILIMKFLNEKIKCSYEWVGPNWLVPDITFEGYIKMATLCVQSGKTGVVEVAVNDGEKAEQESN